MAISDHDRYERYKSLEETAGPNVADTMMAHLPPAGRADVATRRDLEMVELRMGRIADQLRAELHSDMRTQTLVILGLNVSMLGAALALLR